MSTLGSRLVLFGGWGTNFSPLARRWGWRRSEWALLNPAHSPSARQLAAMATRIDEIVLFAGIYPPDPSSRTWTFDGDWHVATLDGASAPGLAGHEMFFFSSRRRHTSWTGDWSSDVCSSD